jgi:uncharacterized protein YegP (UPF0339 family)
MDKVHINEDKAGEFRWHRKARNGEIISQGESHSTDWHARRAAKRANQDTDNWEFADGKPNTDDDEPTETNTVYRAYSPSRADSGRPQPTREEAQGMVGALNQGAKALGGESDWVLQSGQVSWRDDNA